MDRLGTVRSPTAAQALGWLLVLFAALLLSACDLRRPGALEEIQARGTLRVVTLNAPTTYFIGNDGPEGFEYELASRFADELGVKLEILSVADREGLRLAIAEKRADIAAAQLTWNQRWRGVAFPSTSYSSSPMFWVYRRGDPRPRTPADILKRRAVILEDSAEASYLNALSPIERSAIEVTKLPRQLGREPLELVASGSFEVALVDGREFAFARALHPSVDIAFALPKQRALYWHVRRDGRDLLKIVNEFLDRERSTEGIPTLEVATLTPPLRLPQANARQLAFDIEEILPQLQPIFVQAAAETGLDWLLLAALAYQESMWIADALSPNGAQGIMMLMPRTARSLGVENAFDPEENILAGARYLAQLRATIPERIREPDRTWMAIAAYNMGIGHLEDARVLTARQGGDPDSWVDVRERLTLLSEEFWYLQVKNGYARGLETKRLLDRVQQYLALLREEFPS